MPKQLPDGIKRGIPHAALIELVDRNVKDLGLLVKRRRIALSRKKILMFYALDIKLDLGLEEDLLASLCVLNYTNGGSRVRAYSGVSSLNSKRGVVLFRQPITTRATHHFSYERYVEEIVDIFTFITPEFATQIEALKENNINKSRAAAILAKFGSRKVSDAAGITWNTVGRIINEFTKRTHRNLWWLLHEFCEQVVRGREVIGRTDLDKMYDFYCEMDLEARRDENWKEENKAGDRDNNWKSRRPYRNKS